MNAAIRLLLFLSKITVGDPPPIGSEYRITEDSVSRITEDGIQRITE